MTVIDLWSCASSEIGKGCKANKLFKTKWLNGNIENGVSMHRLCAYKALAIGATKSCLYNLT